MRAGCHPPRTISGFAYLDVITDMIPLLWSKEIHGSVGHSDADSIITAPRFGDGNWRGGWWARYQHRTGELVWRRYHRRGACLFAVVDGVIVATTHKCSGVYALSYRTGKKLWSRLSRRADWLLKLFEYLPCDNEGDGPLRIQNDQILTCEGRLLDRKSGAILSCHMTGSGDDASRSSKEAGGDRDDPFLTPRFRYGGIPVQPESPDAIDHSLAHAGLETSGPDPCLVHRHDHAFVIACKPSNEHRGALPSRLCLPANPTDVSHYLIIIRRAGNKIVHCEELGLYRHAEIAWADDTTLAITLQNLKQNAWSYRRDLRVYDVSKIRKAC